MATDNSPPTLFDVGRLFVKYPLRWLGPAVLVAGAASAYALMKPPTWEASQAFIVRAEAGGNVAAPGRFRDLSEMKTFQETLLEIAKNRSVATAALKAVGPPPSVREASTEVWPTANDVSDFVDTIKLAPPKGTEFGSTEVFYLKIRDADPRRAVALADALAEQLLTRYRQLRDERAGSMVRELANAVEIARDDLDQSVAAMKQLESDVGGDLAELRNLEQLGSGDSDLRKLAIELESELRNAETAQRNNKELRTLLIQAQSDPHKLLATPNRLVEAQPALKRLKEGLIDAQLRSSLLLGSMSREHPQVRASLDAEEEVRRHLHAEITAALQGIDAELTLNDQLIADRREKLDEARGRLDHLASLRAEYSSLNGQMQHRMRQLEQAERQLVDARSARAGASSASLLTRIDGPEAGTKPIGPGKTTLLGMGMAVGLLSGIGCLLLTVAPGRRSNADLPTFAAPTHGGTAASCDEETPPVMPELGPLSRQAATSFDLPPSTVVRT